jgi:hypothetical protein
MPKSEDKARDKLVTVRIYSLEREKVYQKRLAPTESFAKILRRMLVS